MIGRKTMVAAGAVLAALIAWSWMGHALRQGSWATLVAEAMVLLGLAHVYVGGRVLRRIPAAQRWRVTTDSRGTVFHPNRLRAAAVMGALMTLCMGLTLIAALQAVGRFDVPLHDPPLARERWLLILLQITGALCGLAALGFAAAFLWAGGDPGSLIVSTRGVALSAGRKTALSWEQVGEVPAMGPPTNNWGIYSEPDLIVEGSPTPLKLGMTMFPADPAPLAAFIRRYWQHPEFRDELDDGRAAQRWRDGQFAR